MTLLPLTYLGNIFYYAHLISDICTIEQHANYIKQTYTNRCSILTSNGIQDLTIPVEKPKDKTPIKDILISYHENWSLLHWRAIEAAYSSTPFFEYFRDDFAPIYEKRWKFLIDFNITLQNLTLELLNYKDIIFCLTESYIDNNSNTANDLREIINPKKFDVSLYDNLKTPYYQVFSNKFGFIPNLSIIDLLFNMGNESRIYLSQIIKEK